MLLTPINYNFLFFYINVLKNVNLFETSTNVDLYYETYVSICI